MNKALIVAILFVSVSFIRLDILSQSTTGSIYPGQNFTNLSADTLFYMKKSKVENIMLHEQISLELITVYEKRIELCDSAIKLKNIEAEKWYKSLLETNQKLEQTELEKLKQEQRNRKMNKVWFACGAVASWLILLAL